jgi:serine/threonine protein kinase
VGPGEDAVVGAPRELGADVTATDPQTLGRYEIEGEIGRGMMGVVYRAFDPALGRTIALKTVRLAFTIPEDQREVFEKRFLAEARVAAALSHPGIVVVHDVGRDPDSGTIYIALEYLEGETLGDLAKKAGPLEWRVALRLVAKIAEALAHAHVQGVVHRDIKPANIMVLPSGDPKIMDFGIAKVPTSQLTATGEFFGTPSYMSPEQARGAKVDGRSDLFSLGSILYLLLTGRQAFPGNNVASILLDLSTEDPKPPSSLVPGIPGSVDAIVAQLLAKESVKRFSTGKAAADAMRAALAAPDRAALPSPAPRKASALLFAGIAGLLLVLALGGGAAFFLLRGTSLLPSPAPGDAAPDAAAHSPGLALLTQPFESPGHLEVGFEYPFRTGRLRVWADDALVLDEPLEGHLVKKVLTVRIHKGILKKTVDVPSGDHSLKVEVEGDGDTQTRKVQSRFKAGATRHLEVTFSGLVRKDLGLEWWS